MTREQSAGVVIGLGVALPALVAAEVFPGYDQLPAPAWLLLSAVAGAVGVALGTGRRRALSAALGAIFGAGSLLAIPFYLDLRSQVGSTFFFLELILPFGLVGLPLLGVWQALDERRVGNR
jgi:hypothetical protein